MRRSLTLILVAAFALVVFASEAQAANPGFIYWTNGATEGIGRAKLDGTDVNQRFIAGAREPSGVVVTDKYVYWGNAETGTIGRATLSGADVNQKFIVGISGPRSLAVSGGLIYWGTATGAVGRANLDGSNPQQSFITGAVRVEGIAVDAHHIYWSNLRTGIERANLDGTQVDQTFIEAPAAAGVAIDSGHIYWSTLTSNSIGRATLDGANVDKNFLDSGFSFAPLTVVGGRIYWGNVDMGTIGQAKLDGTGSVADLVGGIGRGWPQGVAVTGSALPQATASPIPLDYGTRDLLDYGKPKTVTITDTGSAPLAISDAKLGGTNPGDFLISKDDCSNNVLRPGASCAISVLFGPQAPGKRSATLNVSSDDPTPQLSVALSGIGGASLAAAQTHTDPISCTSSHQTVTRVRHHRRHRVRVKVATCSGQVVSGMGRFTTARAIVSRGSRVDATGSARHGPRAQIRLVLDKLRPIKPGRYVLSLRHRVRGRWVDRGVPINIGSTVASG